MRRANTKAAGKKQAKPREKAAVDAEKAATPQAVNKAAAAEFEKETHSLDARGRKRKRKTLRSISAPPSGGTGAKGRRVFNDTENELIVQEHLLVKRKTSVTWAMLS